MARYTGPAFKKSRRYGFSTLENGKDLAKRPYAPGQHGAARRRKASEYKIQLDEKQKVRFTYGMNEKQFHRLFKKASKMSGVTGENFLKLLESRLDNLVYRMGMSNTRRGSRQLVNHGHILVNGKNVDIPSYQVKPGDIIAVREIRKDNGTIKASVEETASRLIPTWLEKDIDNLSGKVIKEPSRDEIDYPVEEHLIVELYSK